MVPPLGAVGRAGGVQPVRVEGVGRGGGGPRRGSTLRLCGAPRPTDGENVTYALCDEKTLSSKTMIIIQLNIYILALT